MTEAPPIRVMVADDQRLFRRSIAVLVDEQDGLEVVGEADDGQEAVEMAERLRPDIILMDVEMPGMGGIDAARIIRERLPQTRIVMLTVSEEEEHLFDALRAGADAYLLKNIRPEQLYAMIRMAMRGEAPISPAVARRLVEAFRSGAVAPPQPSGQTAQPAPAAVAPATAPVPETPAVPAPVVTRRELEVLQLVAEGLSNKEIGARLWITEGTVKNHVHNALEKLHVDNRIQAAAYIVRNGLVRDAAQG